MNGLFISDDTWKYRCIQAFFHRELIMAQKIKDAGEEKDWLNYGGYVTENLITITNIMLQNNNTYSYIKRIAQRSSIIKGYYNSIEKVINKHFDKQEPWIPSLLTIGILRIFSENGFNDFEHINFVRILSEYEKHEDRKENIISTHMRCAEDLYSSLMLKNTDF